MVEEEEDYEEVAEEQESLLKFSAEKYAALASASPFEVAKILLQLQYIPRAYKDDDEGEEGDEDDDEKEDISTDEEDYVKRDASPEKLVKDEDGYVLPIKQAKPRYQMTLKNGIWPSIGRIVSFRYEGLFSLWKGSTPHFLAELGKSIIQPAIEDGLNEKFHLYDPSVIPLALQSNYLPNLSTIIISHTLTGFLLSPLEMLRVHLIAQTADPLHMPLQSYYQAAKHCWDTEDRLKWKDRIRNIISNMFPYPILTALYHFLPSLLQTTSQLLIARFLRYSTKNNPLLYALAWFGCQTLQLLIMSPIETVYRRMLLCGRERRLLKTCVRIPEKEYKSSWSCLYRIVTEESVPQLYRGFLFQSGWNATLAVLSFVSGLEITDDQDYFYF